MRGSHSPSVADKIPKAINKVAAVCGAGMDKITTRGHQCTIREIFKFEDRDAACAAYENVVGQHTTLMEDRAGPTK
jgi:hypothetical protein